MVAWPVTLKKVAVLFAGSTATTSWPAAPTVRLLVLIWLVLVSASEPLLTVSEVIVPPEVSWPV